MKFTCERCNTETKLSPKSNANLTCQSCGCSDIVFDTDVVVASVIPGELGPEQVVRAGEPFFGTHKGGQIWAVDTIELDGKADDGSQTGEGPDGTDEPPEGGHTVGKDTKLLLRKDAKAKPPKTPKPTGGVPRK